MSNLVVYDHSIFSIQEKGGISRYFVELAGRLSSVSEYESHIVAPVHVCRMLKDRPFLPQTGLYIPKIRKTFRLLQGINNLFSSSLIKRLHPKIVHSTYYLPQYRMLKSCKRVVTVFDMIHEKYAENMDSYEKTLPAKKKAIIEKADHIICISEKTRHDVIELLGVGEEKTSVVHLASSFVKQQKHKLAEIDQPYFLYVGSREWPKNFKSLIKAFASFNSLNPDVVLVCFGGGRFKPEEIDLFNSCHLKEEQVRFFEGDDNVMQRFYSNALALIYPSLYEGFGLPLLEAMACGCPVICSNTSSMPEVAGEAAVYFTPTVVDEIAGAMERVADSSGLRNELVTEGFKRIQQFSWEKCARETAQVYRLCLQ